MHETLNVESLTQADWYSIEYRSDLESVVSYVAERYGHNISYIKHSAPLERGDGEGWYTCPEQPDGYKMDLDNDNDYVMHFIIPLNTWEIGNDDREKAVSKQKVICVYCHDGSETIEVTSHDMGKCPVCIYKKDVIFKKVYKATATFYLSVEAEDVERDLDILVEKRMTDELNGLADQMYENVYEAIEYQTDAEPEHLTVHTHRLNVQEVPRVPRRR